MFTTLYAGIRRSQTHTYARSLTKVEFRMYASIFPTERWHVLAQVGECPQSGVIDRKKSQ